MALHLANCIFDVLDCAPVAVLLGLRGQLAHHIGSDDDISSLEQRLRVVY